MTAEDFADDDAFSREPYRQERRAGIHAVKNYWLAMGYTTRESVPREHRTTFIRCLCEIPDLKKERPTPVPGSEP